MIDRIGNIGLLSTSSVPENLLFAETLQAIGIDDPDFFSALGKSDEAQICELLGDPSRASYLAQAQFKLGQFNLGRFSLFAPNQPVIARVAETFASVSMDGSVFRTPAIKGAFVCMAGAKESGEKKSEPPFAKLGQEIVRLRKEKGLSQYRLALLVGISQQNLSSIELGFGPGRKWWPQLEAVLEFKAGYFAKKLLEFGLSPHNAHRGKVQPLSRRISPRVGLFQKFGQKIAELRVAAGLTQTQLAERADMDSTALARIESGRAPGWKHHAALEKALGLAEGHIQKMLREMGLPTTRVEYEAILVAEKKGIPAYQSILLGKELRKLREAKRISQIELAKRLRMNRPHYCEIEAGLWIPWKHLDRLEEILEVEKGYFKKKLKEWGFPDSRNKSILRSASKKIKKEIRRKWKRLGKEVQQLRVERDWTQKELAKKVIAKRGYIARIEAGRAPGFRLHPLFETAFDLPRGYFAEKLKEWGLLDF